MSDEYGLGYGDGHKDGHNEGYHMGEMERVALATANSELRSQVRELMVDLANEAGRR